MGYAYGTHGEKRNGRRVFLWRNPKERERLQDLGIDVRIILKNRS